MELRTKDFRTISQIADRAVALYERLGMINAADQRFARTAIAGELLTVHREIVPLRLDEMLAGSDLDFAHDIGGIHRHLLDGTRAQKARFSQGFMPRFAMVKLQEDVGAEGST